MQRQINVGMIEYGARAATAPSVYSRFDHETNNDWEIGLPCKMPKSTANMRAIMMMDARNNRSTLS